jgi:hypothetical protein
VLYVFDFSKNYLQAKSVLRDDELDFGKLIDATVATVCQLFEYQNLLANVGCLRSLYRILTVNFSGTNLARQYLDGATTQAHNEDRKFQKLMLQNVCLLCAESIVDFPHFESI